MTAMSLFSAGESRWIERLGNLRNVVRQEVIARQLAPHVRRGTSVLDVGCGQGTQGLRLAARGAVVTGVDPSRELLARFSADAARAGLSIEVFEGTIDSLPEVLADRRFDLVCAHGLLMYLDDRAGAIATLRSRLAPRGRLSFTFRNGHALAMRPGLRRDWAGAMESFDAVSYVNELGISATAARLEEVEGDLAAVGLRIVEWFGVRVFNDAVAVDMPADGEELALLLDAEEEAGRRDPYRWLASQFHIIAEPVIGEPLSGPGSGPTAPG
jgi:S-adenosylmethionine-dependent methyltransferase